MSAFSCGASKRSAMPPHGFKGSCPLNLPGSIIISLLSLEQVTVKCSESFFLPPFTKGGLRGIARATCVLDGLGTASAMHALHHHT